MKQVKPYDIVTVEWVDSSGNHCGWTNEISLPMLIRSVGIVIESRRNYIVITTSTDLKGFSEDPLTIVASAIRRVRKIGRIDKSVPKGFSRYASGAICEQPR